MSRFSTMCCSICLETINSKHNKVTKCGHTFHKKCIGKWLKTKSSCPMCRKTIKKHTKKPFDIEYATLEIERIRYMINTSAPIEDIQQRVVLLRDG